jgi:hypothetical protein
LQTNLFSQGVFYKKNDTVYNWSESGLNLRKSISRKSKIINKISNGAILVIDSTVAIEMGDNSFDVEIIKSIDYNGIKTKNYLVNGKMIKVRYNNIVGFVYSGFLSHIKPFDLSYLYNLEIIYKKEYGIAKEFNWGIVDYGNKEIIYNNGIVQRITNGYSWFETSYVIPNLTFQEGLLIVSKIFTSNNSDEKWYISKSSNTMIEFKSFGDAYIGSIQKINNLIILTINGSD